MFCCVGCWCVGCMVVGVCMSVVLDVVCVCVLDVLIDGGVGVCVDVMLCGE